MAAASVVGCRSSATPIGTVLHVGGRGDRTAPDRSGGSHTRESDPDGQLQGSPLRRRIALWTRHERAHGSRHLRPSPSRPRPARTRPPVDIRLRGRLDAADERRAQNVRGPSCRTARAEISSLSRAAFMPRTTSREWWLGSRFGPSAKSPAWRDGRTGAEPLHETFACHHHHRRGGRRRRVRRQHYGHCSGHPRPGRADCRADCRAPSRGATPPGNSTSAGSRPRPRSSPTRSRRPRASLPTIRMSTSTSASRARRSAGTSSHSRRRAS